MPVIEMRRLAIRRAPTGVDLRAGISSYAQSRFFCEIDEEYQK
jgi:hypothetical protein